MAKNSGDKLTRVLGGYTVNGEIGFGTEVSAFFLSLSSMDQNIYSGILGVLCGAKVAEGSPRLSQLSHEYPLSHVQQWVYDWW
ncbi:hypothetical protein Tco_0368760 [Tanacetum coccineum]